MTIKALCLLLLLFLNFLLCNFSDLLLLLLLLLTTLWSCKTLFVIWGSGPEVWLSIAL